MKNKFRLLCPSMYCLQWAAVWIHHEDKLKLRSCSIYWPDGVAVLISHQDKFKLRSYSAIQCIGQRGGSFDPLNFNGLYPSMYFSKGMAVLIPHEDKFNLRSDSIYWPGEGSFDPLLQ